MVRKILGKKSWEKNHGQKQATKIMGKKNHGQQIAL